MAGQDVNDMFTYHHPNAAKADLHEGIRSYGRYFAQFIEQEVPDLDEKRTAIEKVREAVMWANAAIARQEDQADDPAHRWVFVATPSDDDDEDEEDEPTGFETAGQVNLDHFAQGRPCCLNGIQAMTPGTSVPVYLFKQDTPDDMPYLVDIHEPVEEPEPVKRWRFDRTCCGYYKATTYYETFQEADQARREWFESVSGPGHNPSVAIVHEAPQAHEDQAAEPEQDSPVLSREVLAYLAFLTLVLSPSNAGAPTNRV